jgi:hypothetical protein
MRASRRPRPWELLLFVAFGLLAIRLGVLALGFGRTSLQMDFSAFYAAGQAAAAGLSPYENHVARVPPIWDGVDTYRHSRFLYPPLVARLFQPLTLLGYLKAKLVWMLLCLAALSGALWIAARLAGVIRRPRALLAVGILAAGYHPLLTLLERGQSDSITLLLLVAALAWTARDHRAWLGPGLLLALATLLKLHCVFVLPFVLIRRRFRVLGGFALAAAALLLLDAVVDGPSSLARYFRRELPRIARHGERGTPEMRLPAENLRPLVEMLRAGRTVMDGRTWDVESFRFALNASAVRTPLGRATWRFLRGIGLRAEPAHVSLVFLGVGFVALLAAARRYGLPEGARELVYWQAVLVIVLLCAPATWVMNAVWLLPAGIIVAAELPRASDRPHRLAVLLCALGLLVAALPDLDERVSEWALGRAAAEAKIITAELLCLAGLLGLWRACGRARVGGVSAG